MLKFQGILNKGLGLNGMRHICFSFFLLLNRSSQIMKDKKMTSPHPAWGVGQLELTALYWCVFKIRLYVFCFFFDTVFRTT